MRSLFGQFRHLFREDMSRSDLQAKPGTKDQPVIRIGIVALVAGTEDRELLSRLAAEHQWSLSFADTCGEAWNALSDRKAPIVLCDRDLPATDWRDVIQMMVSCPHQACAILVSKVADDYLWNEVIRRGGHDLLSKPLREEDVLRAIRLAWSYWRSSMNVQPMLTKHYL